MIWRLGYRLLLWLLLPWVLMHLWWRGRRQSGYREHIAERFGAIFDKLRFDGSNRPIFHTNPPLRMGRMTSGSPNRCPRDLAGRYRAR